MESEQSIATRTALLSGSLTDEALLAESDRYPVIRLQPEAHTLKIGAQSLMDRGRAAVLPVIEEIVENLKRHKMLIGTGAGTRARHAYSECLELGIPTGVMSVLGYQVSLQNARMIQFLLAPHGVALVETHQFSQLPFFMSQRNAIVFVGSPPYSYWQPNPETGRIPPYRSDTGSFLVSEVFGTRSMIYVKDEDGLYTADPKKDRNAKFIPKITADEMLEGNFGDVVVEHAVLKLMKNAKHRRSVQIINGLKKGNLTRALNGEHVGTIITA